MFGNISSEKPQENCLTNTNTHQQFLTADKKKYLIGHIFKWNNTENKNKNEHQLAANSNFRAKQKQKKKPRREITK